MEFREVMERRQSCRLYAERAVEREKLAAVLQAGRMSPSGCNSQRWVLVGVDEPALCGALAAALADTELNINLYAGQIPAYIAIVSHPARHLTPTQKTILATIDHSLIDIGAAAQQMCLAATDLGLGSVMLGWFDQDAVRQALGVPAGQQVLLLIGIGYPRNEDIRSKKRFSENEIIRWNGYDKAK